GALLSASRDGTARLWNIAAGSHRVLRHDAWVCAAAVSRESASSGLAATGDNTGRGGLGGRSGREAGSFSAAQKPMHAPSLSPDGRLLATASDDHTAKILSLADRRQLAGLVHEAAVFAVAFAPDGSMLATAGGKGEVRLFETSGKEIAFGGWRFTAPVHALA